jgi:hypothetical protein
MVMIQNITLAFMLLSAAYIAHSYIKHGVSTKEIYLVAASVFIAIVSSRNIVKPYDFSLLYNLYFVVALYSMSSLIIPSSKKIYYISVVETVLYIVTILSFIAVDDPKIILTVYTILTLLFLTYWHKFQIKTFTMASLFIFIYICLMPYVFIRCAHFDKIDIKAVIVFSQIMSFIINTSYTVRASFNAKKQKYLSEKD